jgi:hypothetical protein
MHLPGVSIIGKGTLSLRGTGFTDGLQYVYILVSFWELVKIKMHQFAHLT